MSYTIKTTNGSTIAIVQDATLNTIATSLTLVGRDYAGYGAFLNENFVYLLENFAANTAPQHQITGQLWYDTSIKTLKVYDSGLATWKPISSSIAQVIPPSNGTIGDLWFKTNTYQLYVYTGDITVGTNGWQLIGPPTTTSGTLSGAVVETILDSSANSHVVIKFYIENNIVAIMSYDTPAYTPQTTLDGFSLINPGFNLVSSSTLAGSQMTGDASNALYLNGVSSGQFLRNDQNASSAYQLTLGGGLIIGTDLNVKTVSANNEVRIDNFTNQRDTNFYANVNGSANRTRLLKLNATTGSVDFANATISQLGDIVSNASLTIGTTSTFNGASTFKQNLYPGNVGSIDIGSSTYNFANVFAQSLFGNVVGNVTANLVTVTGNINVTGIININSNVVASQSWVTSYVQTSGKNSQGQRTISTNAPSGGNDGDIWYQV
jgi:hypothetical protein